VPNIAIYEGGKAARMNGVSRITTDDGNDGKITWVPQSERQTGTLYVSENGTYRAEDEGLHSWSKVTVRLAGAPLGLEVPTLPDPVTGAEIPTGELGELEPVAPAGLEPIEDEPISADEAESILEDTEFDPSDLDPDSPNYDDAMEAIADALGTDPEDVKVIDPEKKEDVKKEQPKVEDKGQVIAGTDPETGETTTITPSGKETKPVPVAIVITKLPNKLSYSDGDTIDFTGIVVKLYSKYEETEDESGTHIDAKPYRDNRYPDGTIPFNELIFPITEAGGARDPTYTTPADDSSSVYKYSGVTFSFVEVPVGTEFLGNLYEEEYGWRTFTIVGADAPVFAVGYTNSSIRHDYVYIASAKEFHMHYRGPTGLGGVSEAEIYNDHYEIQCSKENNAWLPTVPINSGFVYSDMVKFGSGGAAKRTVPVQWRSPYDGETLETSYKITVMPSTD
jgi:hypothetical protein